MSFFHCCGIVPFCLFVWTMPVTNGAPADVHDAERFGALLVFVFNVVVRCSVVSFLLVFYDVCVRCCCAGHHFAPRLRLASSMFSCRICFLVLARSSPVDLTGPVC
eukprot:Opistho-2@18542